MNPRLAGACLGFGMAALLLTVHAPARAGESAAAWERQIIKDWIHAEEIEVLSGAGETITTGDDAAGGCDGIKNGGYGFHTDQTQSPWWQVDLQREQPLTGLKIWNRTVLHERAARIQVLISSDGTNFQQVYEHNGTVFKGVEDGKPLNVELGGSTARFVRLTLPGKSYLHLDEVEVFGSEQPRQNLALGKPADQSSVSQWSVRHESAPMDVDWAGRALAVLDACDKLAREIKATEYRQSFDRCRESLGRAENDEMKRAAYIAARQLQRRLAFRNPLLRSVNAFLFTKRVPGSFSHMSDQYYGWWSRPGGGIFILRNFLEGSPEEKCLTKSFPEPGSFLRPTLSYDATKVLFAWCRYYPHLASEPNKLDKANVPEDAFYHLFEMNIDGSEVRQLTRGKYDDFDGRYLPDGRIVFTSTRRGQAVQTGPHTGAATMARPDLPDSYVRCGGGPERPVAVYTLHTMAGDGSDIVPISPFEMFEWNPEIATDGGILYSRWDYIDRDNMPYMGLWTINPDGSNARSIYKNYTKSPHCVFEPRPIPGSRKLLFTASAHHSQTMGSLVLLDPSMGSEGADPIKRLTPEVAFPEAEGWPLTHYSSPWPLSERFYLTTWGAEGARVPGPNGWNRWHSVQLPENGTAIYFYDAELRTRELLWADESISCTDATPVRARERPPAIATQLAADSEKEGAFMVADVYRGLTNVQRGEIKSLRIVGVPPKTHPTMNHPEIGLTRDDPGKYVIGTAPVESDGSAYFRVPSGVIVFFQALDARGVAVQTMRSATHVQPGQTLGCIGCHEHRQEAPVVRSFLANSRPPSSLSPGPRGSWPLKYDLLVQPVLDANCVRCHDPRGTNSVARRIDLTTGHSYKTLVSFGKPSITDQVLQAYRHGSSIPGEGIAEKSRLVALLAPGHQDVEIDREGWDRLLTWLDTYAQRLGHFSDEQEDELDELRRASAHLFGRRTVGKGPMLNAR